MSYVRELRALSLDDIYLRSQAEEMQAETQTQLGLPFNPYYDILGPRAKVSGLVDATDALAKINYFLAESNLPNKVFDVSALARHLSRDPTNLIDQAKALGFVATYKHQARVTDKGQQHDPSRVVLRPEPVGSFGTAAGLAVGAGINLYYHNFGEAVAVVPIVATSIFLIGARIDAIRKHRQYEQLGFFQ